MVLDKLSVVAIILMVVLVTGWIFYNIYTGKIIKDLIKENTALEAENKHLKNLVAALRKKNEK